MELEFRKEVLSCMGQILNQKQSQELTQEVRLSDAMPDIGRVIGAWSQPILRGKEWRGDSIAISGGLMVWVLYAPEDGTQERWLDTWLPFQMRWDIPRDTPDGVIRAVCSPRFTDARTVSARKLMIRAGVTAAVQAMAACKPELAVPCQVPPDVQLRRDAFLLRLIQEAGEKAFQIDEELQLPPTCPGVEKLVYFTASPELTEQQVSADKVILRGNVNLHLLYRSEEGSLYAWELAHPFSQLAQLEQVYSPEAQADVQLGVTALELEPLPEGQLRLKCEMIAQYAVDDEKLITAVSDAYSTVRPVKISMEEAKLPAIQDKRREQLSLSKLVQQQPARIVEVSLLADQPEQRNSAAWQLPCRLTMLYYGEDGLLQSADARVEEEFTVNAGEGSCVNLLARACPSPEATVTADGVQLRGVCEVQVDTSSGQGIPTVTALELGEEQTPDPARPSLILRRAGSRTLWELAKENGSTVDFICQANRLEGEPDPQRMLLIPVM